MNKEKHSRTPIYSALKEYKDAGITHFDVPGHKKNPDTPVGQVFGETTIGFDANSTIELDILTDPSGIIQEAAELMADAYGCDDAFLLVNGSTFGVQAMIMSVCRPKDRIIMPRNVHKSAINAVILCGAIPVFIDPEIDMEFGISNGVTVETVRDAIDQNPDAKALFIINPTYFGVACDLRRIIQIAHRRDIPVIVDQAHGAHLSFHYDLPDSAAELGADLTTISMHKTAGSLTQSSVLLYNKGYISKNRVRDTINLMQTTSASYLLMSSLDITRSHLAVHGEELYDGMLKLCRDAIDRLSRVPGIKVFSEDYINGEGVFDVDETKLVVKVNGLGFSGFEVYDIMKKDYNIQLELGETYVVLAVVGVGDTESSIEKLVGAFEDLSKRFYGTQPVFKKDISSIFQRPKTRALPREAYYSPKITLNINDALGQVAGESVMIYPPGIPLIIPGEVITEEIISIFNFYVEQGCRIVSVEPEAELIRVLADTSNPF
jgi:arginine/lysine/ornithine decarboxylase